MNRLINYTLLLLCPAALSASILTETFPSATTLAGLENRGWTVTQGLIDNPAALEFYDSGLRLINNGGGSFNLRSPLFAPLAEGSLTMQLGASSSASHNQGRFVLSGDSWATNPGEVVRLELNPNNTALRLIGNAGNQDFSVANYNLGMGGSLLNVRLDWDATTITLSVDDVVLGTTGYRNPAAIPDRFEFVAGWQTSSGVRAVAANNITVVPEPSTYAALLGVLGLACVAVRRRCRDR